MNIRASATGSDAGGSVHRISTQEVLGQDDNDRISMETPLLQDMRGDARIRWVYFMLGAATLLSWNAMINANSFFMSRLSGSPLRQSFSSYLSSVFTASNVVALGHAIVTSKQSSPSRRAFWSTALTSAIVSILFLTTFLHPSSTPFFYFIMISAFSLSGCASYLSNSVFAGAALFGAPYMQSMMAGQAAVAVAVSGVQVISSAISVWGTTPLAPVTSDIDSDGKAEEKSARIFFGISALYMIATLLAYKWLASLQVYTKTMGALEDDLKARVVSDEADERQALLPAALPSTVEDNQILRIFQTNLIYNFAVGYVFAVTLAVYPAITVTIKPTNPNTHPLLFSAVHFLVFSSGDLLGRYSCSFPKLIIWSARRILVLAVLRTLFIPVFLLCNVEHSFPVTPFINSDLVYMLLLCALGVSNGYVSTLCMLGAPSLEHNIRLRGRQEDVDVASTVAAFCLIVGLAVGGFASFGVRAVICNCNPFAS
ncbi:nucleoside transporter-domain-containing protein [Suillus paluster]|uniref:nucleoside transporter-domain-containing protein n=1 Tax=Suillus paluster TaxID=48578 RepID=UPI001B87C767|nr:nucleoside transporter-domain-containing protein [Suillus paluster]KAG1753735.1 nucleoside transporter-domain-containing protein [Suillus paluster]